MNVHSQLAQTYNAWHGGWADQVTAALGTTSSFAVNVEFDAQAQVGSTTLSIKGDVYGAHVDELAAKFLRRGLSGLTTLDGSFLILVEDDRSDVSYLINDSIGSRACYLWRAGESLLVTDRLAKGPRERFALDPAGLMSYLSCDGTRANLTPYEGVSSLPGASVIELRHERKTHKYWRPPLEPERISDFEASETLLRLFRDSIRRRVESLRPETVVLSLSGGADSKGLLGLLTELIDPNLVHTFTYYNGAQYGDMDLPLAKRAAETAGVRHQAIRGYRGDPIATVVDNAWRGDGVAHFCDDADVWPFLADLGPGAILMAGDRQSHHMTRAPDDLPIGTLLRLVSFHPAASTGWLLDRIPEESRERLVKAWDERYEEVLAELSAGDDWRQVTHRAYIENRVHTTLTLWRERFCSQVGKVASPFLDRRVLDFVSRLPTKHNAVDGDFLHRRVLANAFPALFEMPQANGGWNMPDWGKELGLRRHEVEQMVARIPSRLDDWIPPDVLVGLVRECAEKTPALTTMSSRWRNKARRLAKQNRLILGAVRAAKFRDRLSGIETTSRGHALRRLLTLRTSMADPDALAEFLSNRTAGVASN